jgi:cytochrome c oxidase subunit IV
MIKKIGKFMREIFTSLILLLINAIISLPSGYFLAGLFKLNNTMRWLLIVIISIIISNIMAKIQNKIKKNKENGRQN